MEMNLRKGKVRNSGRSRRVIRSILVVLRHENGTSGSRKLAKATKPSEPTPVEPTLLEWMQSRLRFGRGDDTVIVFVPSHARDKSRLKDQDVWAAEALDLFGRLFGGATGFPNLRGIWRDDENGGELLADEPIMIQSLTKREDVENVVKIEELASFLKRMGKRTKQGAVAVVFNDAIHFISNYV